MLSYNRMDDPRRESMISFRRAGLTWRKIGPIFGLSGERVRQILGPEFQQRPYSYDIDPDWLREQVEKYGRSAPNIAKELGAHFETVKRRIRLLGLKRQIKLGPGEWPTEPSHLDRHGYRRVWTPFHPNTGKGKVIGQHRLVAEKHLQRYLEASEVVHHINEDRADNRAQNLVVFENVGYHMCSFHRDGGKNLDESRVTWVVPESRDNMIRVSGWPKN